MATSADISERIMEAVMAQKLAPGSRLGEQQLAMLFDCSRTIVREALTRLAARGIVTVSSRRGWLDCNALRRRGNATQPRPQRLVGRLRLDESIEK